MNAYELAEKGRQIAASGKYASPAKHNGHAPQQIPADPHADVPPPNQPPDAEAANGAIDNPRSWRPVDVEPVLSGRWTPATPTVGHRSDGVGLFYPGKVHTIASESEAGKTWLALAAAFDELRAGHSVLYIDFEDDQGGVVGRLMTFQARPEWIRERFCYLRPTDALGTGASLNDLSAIVAAYRPTFAVVDGVTEAMTMHGLDPLSNRDIAVFGRVLPRRLAAAGCATACLDHVPKAADARGRYAIGGVHKLNGLDGAGYILEAQKPFGVGITGQSTILISKDRPGQLRRHGHRRKDGLTVFGNLELISHDETNNEFEIRPAADPSEDFRPTVLMGKICATLERHGPMPQRQILAMVKGKRDYAREALAQLQRDGYVSDGSPHKLLKPWAETQ